MEIAPKALLSLCACAPVDWHESRNARVTPMNSPQAKIPTTVHHRFLPTLLALALSGLLGGATPGCGGGDNGISMAQMEQTCTTVAKGICGRLTRCQLAFRAARDYQDGNCTKVEHDRCFRTLSRKNTGDSVTNLEACAAARTAQSCGDYFAGTALTACDTPKGPLKDGQACVVSAQCDSQYCDLAASASCGKCAQRLAAGGVCDANGDCQVAFVCKRAMAADLTGACTKRALSGEPCNADNGCADNLVCSGARTENMVAIDGVCRARTADAGMPCNDDLVCLRDLSCIGFARAKMTNGTCQPLVTVEGAPCGGQSAGCQGNLDLYCFTDPADKTKHTCKKRTYADGSGMCNNLPDGTAVGCKNAASCVRPAGADAANPTKRPDVGVCTPQVGKELACNTDGADGATCQPGLSCIVSSAGAKTGICQFRDYDMCAASTK